jgi:hypothetical protein
MRLALILVALFLFPVQNQTPEAAFKQRVSKFKNSKRFEYKYDKFKDMARVSVGPFMLTGAPTYISTGFYVFTLGRLRVQG